MTKLWTLIIIILVTSCSVSRQKKPIWQDEFNYTGQPDSTKWSHNVGGHGWGNNELQYYTNQHLKNARVANGQLIIEAHKENYQQNKYTSARLVTKANWQYGTIQVKAKIPGGRGCWPAIWMLAANKPLRWPDDGEIDIMEHVGHNPTVVHASVHTKTYHHSIGTQKTANTIVPDFDTAWHIYSCTWTKEKVTVTVDGKKYFTFNNEHKTYNEWPFANKMYLILNIAVGGNWGGEKGVDDTIFPKQMLIDYVRVYQH
jgi:beta-glucanase (GH16 family)